MQMQLEKEAGTTPDPGALAVSDTGLPAPNPAADLLPDELWKPYRRLPVQLAVAIPLQDIPVTYLARLKPGMVLRSAWAAVENVPLSAGDIFLANVAFEPSGSNLGIRISDFIPRTVPVYTRVADLDQRTETPVPASTPEAAEAIERLNVMRLKTSLCFGTALVSLKEILQLTMGDIIALDRPVNAPVSVVVRGSVIATGHLVLSSGFYAIQITEIAQMTRSLEFC